MTRKTEIKRRLRLLHLVHSNRRFPAKIRAEWNALTAELERIQ